MLDLGSGGGIDVLLSARRVGPTGKAYGLDMTDEMLELAARQPAPRPGSRTSSSSRARSRTIPLPDDSVDVVISNCVINLSRRQAAPSFARRRACCEPGGRFAVSDVVADADMDEATRADMQEWTGCIAGALTRAEFERELGAAGFEDVEIQETHRVHEHAASAIIRARVAADDARPRSSSTTPRPSTGAGRTRSGARSRSTSSAIASSGRSSAARTAT